MDVSKDKVAVVTRVHTSSAKTIAEPAKIREFVESVLKYAELVVVCIGIEDEKRRGHYLQAVRHELGSEVGARVLLLPVCPWGRFTSALNAALVWLLDGRCGYVAFQSLEFRAPIGAMQALLQRLRADPDVLVAGPAMSGHQFQLGRQPLQGRSCPWNTLAVWALPLLTLTGFPLVGDGGGMCAGGVEEVSAISLLQHLHPQLQALLVQLEGIAWNTAFEDKARKDWHEAKMASKTDRPAKQLALMGLAPGWVQHVV